ncbi:hypothetical protein WN51_07457 [Melipona quadrifasciata]|uniref:Uncharacterized protein n=1 Tax=Melipona quadrifasciata TaxID=166423 RepID=A0A0M9A8F7_9HYME|nr:hypothetical protein WN51_07457 [Melipona quadrifasciata]
MKNSDTRRSRIGGFKNLYASNVEINTDFNGLKLFELTYPAIFNCQLSNPRRHRDNEIEPIETFCCIIITIIIILMYNRGQSKISEINPPSSYDSSNYPRQLSDKELSKMLETQNLRLCTVDPSETDDQTADFHGFTRNHKMQKFARSAQCLILT